MHNVSGTSKYGIAVATLLTSMAACSDSKSSPQASTASPDVAANAGVGTKPLYALNTLLFNDQGSTTYINLIDSLAAQETVTLDKAREFPGYAAADAFRGKIIVSDGEKPQLTRFAISDDRAWTAEQTLGFGNYATVALTASIYVSDTKAYAPFDVTNHVVWSPADFSIVAPMAAPPGIPLARGAMNAARGYAHAVSGNRAYQPYYWSDASYLHYAPLSQVAVVDTTKDEVVASVDVPCPHMHLTTKDEAGNIYFSNGQGSIPGAVLDATQPRNCIARIKAGEDRLDETFTVSFRDLAGGREGGNFFYVRDGIALFIAYHAERDAITAATEPDAVSYSSSYHLWTVDLKTMRARMMDGIDFTGGQFVGFNIDDRTFVAMPKGDYSSTAVYEITPAGTAEKRFDVQGWMFHMFRVR